MLEMGGRLGSENLIVFQNFAFIWEKNCIFAKFVKQR